jgi:hypothetical protein
MVELTSLLRKDVLAKDIINQVASIIIIINRLKNDDKDTLEINY